MKITDSILDNMFGHTNAPDSPGRTNWIKANARFRKGMESELRKLIMSKGVDQTDELEVLAETWRLFHGNKTVRKIVVEDKENRAVRVKAMLRTVCRFRIIDHFAKIREREATQVSWDHLVDENVEGTHEKEWVDCADKMLQSWQHETEIREKAASVISILGKLAAQNVISKEHFAIFSARVAGKSAKQVAQEHGTTEGNVNQITYEVRRRLKRAFAVLSEGGMEDDAVVAAGGRRPAH